MTWSPQFSFPGLKLWVRAVAVSYRYFWCQFVSTYWYSRAVQNIFFLWLFLSNNETTLIVTVIKMSRLKWSPACLGNLSKKFVDRSPFCSLIGCLATTVVTLLEINKCHYILIVMGNGTWIRHVLISAGFYQALEWCWSYTHGLEKKSGAQETLTRSQGRVHHLSTTTALIMSMFTKCTDDYGTRTRIFCRMFLECWSRVSCDFLLLSDRIRFMYKP
jgi:hypothetical protein